jgi:transcription elongation GreA/GreB family factor
LPPGAINYITARGARRLRAELTQANTAGKDPERVAELEQILKSVTIVDPPQPGDDDVVFGATLTVEKSGGEQQNFTVVGVDELGLEPDAVSWVSPLGKALLAAELGGRVTVGEESFGRVVKVEYRRE